MNDIDVPATAEVIRVGELAIKYLKEADPISQMGAFELVVPPGSNVPPPHSHAASEELVYVLEGTLRYSVGGETRDLRPGEVMATPRGVVHAFANPHAVAARALVINTPDIGADFFRAVGSIVNAGGPPDRAALQATMQRYGLVPAPLPGAPAR